MTGTPHLPPRSLHHPHVGIDQFLVTSFCRSPAVLRTVRSLRGAGHLHLSLGQTLRDQLDRGHRS
ncbi:hypothetical protein EYF80_024960 [Liparis tanakae]|uniref:Uncharacterized protein n=1 Tax=Liparis tanakae TaxID=230148 RepID=A0A4Z2HHL9_9TELE|nr:hypothetical protein EYF80_024960 [Liparis tanakae]